MKILLVSNGYPPSAVGGVEIYTQDLARGLAQRGHQVTVFCRESDFSVPDYQISDMSEDGIRVIRLVNDYKMIASYRHTFLDTTIEHFFVSLLENITPQIVHINHLIALSARLPQIVAQQKLPQIITLHDFWPICQRVNLINWQGYPCPGPRFEPNNTLNCTRCVSGGPEKQAISNSFNWLVKLGKRITSPRFRKRIRQLLPKADQQLAPLYTADEIFAERSVIFRQSIIAAQKILAPSNFVRQQYLINQYPAQKIGVVPLGINIAPSEEARQPLIVNRQPRLPKTIIRFAAIGTLAPIKGLDVLIRAFKQTPNKSFRLDIYGRDDTFPHYSQSLKRLAKTDKRISFKGSFNPAERAEVYQQIDILVIPSTVPESFSLVCREALLLGKPVIAARTGALPEIIQDQVNGFLFNPKDEKSLQSILARIANEPDILQSLQCPGPFPIIQFNAHIDTIEQLYGEIDRQVQIFQTE